jgi:O-acetyl-ADP-ribose deacetylase (regulator of RNase III)
VGPRFQEPDEAGKLRDTVTSALKVAQDKGIKQLAFPPMGCGFYGIPWELSAKVMFETLAEHLNGQTTLDEVIVCLRDTREFQPFQACFEAMG